MSPPSRPERLAWIAVLATAAVTAWTVRTIALPDLPTAVRLGAWLPPLLALRTLHGAARWAAQVTDDAPEAEPLRLEAEARLAAAAATTLVALLALIAVQGVFGP